SPRTRNADPCQTLTLSPDLSLPAGKEKALTVIFQREAALRVLEAALAYGERARAPLGYLLRRELANEVLGKIPAIAIDDEETARLTSLLCKEAVVEAAPEVLASCASALGQVIEAEIVKRHREEVERANRAQGMLQMKAMAGLAPRNTYASCYCFSSNPKAEEYKFGLNMKQLTEATDALVSLSWRLAPEVHEKAFMVAQGLLAGGKDCLPISIVQRLEESANRDKRRYSIGAEEDLREKRVPLDTFVGETLKPYVGYDGRFAVESAFNEAERCHSIRVRGLGNMSEEMARKLFQEIAFRAALLCPPPLSRTIELCFEAGDSFFTTGLDSENVLNFYYQRGSILNAGYFAQRMGMEIIRQQKTGAIVLKGGEKC
ncbi:MAG: hypothetical protein Q8N98_02475, partial [bacterium]|nr:hypothetical protein [bacterium]